MRRMAAAVGEAGGERDPIPFARREDGVAVAEPVRPEGSVAAAAILCAGAVSWREAADSAVETRRVRAASVAEAADSRAVAPAAEGSARVDPEGAALAGPAVRIARRWRSFRPLRG